MPYTVIQYTAAEVEQILKEHAQTLVNGNADLSKVAVEFMSNTTGAPVSVSFTRANVTFPVATSGPRRGDRTSIDRNPTSDDIRLSGLMHHRSQSWIR